MNSEQIRDAEYCIDQYFDRHLSEKLGFYLSCRNAAYVGDKSSDFTVRNAFVPSGEYASAVTLNYPALDIEKLQVEMVQDKTLHHDMQVLADTWREAVVAKVGQQRYKELSSHLGADLATSYVLHRLEMRMVDYEVEHNPVQGSLEYILDKGRRSSLLSYLSADNSALQQYIDKKTIEKYDPNLLERGAGRALGTLIDTTITAPTMGVSSWAGLTKFVVADIGLSLANKVREGKEQEQLNLGQYISAAVFDGDINTLGQLRQQSHLSNPYSSDTIQSADSQLGHKIVRRDSGRSLFAANPKIGMDVPKLPDYSALTSQSLEMSYAIHQHFADQRSADNQTQQQQSPQNATSPVIDAQPTQQSVSGWTGLMDGMGLSDFGTVGKNLGYVLAMLPDMLIGMFTGKSRNLKFGDNMMPIAAIIAGMFVKNPMLKMLLVGLGGANLLNKAGHEALENKEGMKPQPVRQYRQYPDEVLDLRIVNPVMKGNTLVATIDNTPSVITISDDAVDAYYKGALPLNTLANAVLRKYDAQQQAVQENYDRQLAQTTTEERAIAIK